MSLLKTPFHAAHVRAGAKMTGFAGYEMPVQYAGILKEHAAVRGNVGLFDVSHMGEFLVEGPQALDLVQAVTINDASVLTPGRAQYSALCHGHGGIVDDLLVYRLSEDRWMLVVNASNIAKDFEHIRSHNRFDARLTDISAHTCLLAVQGPAAPALLQRFTDVVLADIPYYHFRTGRFMGMEDVVLSATGYTGEAGFELYFPASAGDPIAVWDALVAAGAEPCGLGARDALRLEMGFALYGNDIDDGTHPLEAGLGWITKLQKGPFVGREALVAAKEAGIARKLVGFVTEEARAIPRPGYALQAEDGTDIGTVTSGGPSVTTGTGIGLGYVAAAHAAEGTAIRVVIRNQAVPARVVKPPFIKKR